MRQKRLVWRWCLLSAGLLCAAAVVHSDLLGALAQPKQPITDLQLKSIQIVGPTNLKNLQINVTVENPQAGDRPFQLEYSLTKVGQVGQDSMRNKGVEVGECFVDICTIQGRERTVPIVVKLGDDMVLEPDATYQLKVFFFHYLPDQGCGNTSCVTQNFFKYSKPELHPVRLDVAPPSPSLEGTKVSLQATIENTGAALAPGSMIDASFKYCRQLSPSPCDPDTTIKVVHLDSPQLGALMSSSVGVAMTLTVPLDPAQVLLDSTNLSGQVRFKVSVRLTGTQGEVDDSNNELIIPYRIVSRTAISHFVVSPIGQFRPNSRADGGIIAYFDRNGSQICTYRKDGFLLTDPSQPQEVAKFLKCFKFDSTEITNMLLSTSEDDLNLCELFVARPDGKLSRAKCALDPQDPKKVTLLNPLDQSMEFLNITIDNGRRLNQLLLVGTKLLISTNRGKIFSLDISDPRAQPKLVLEVVDTSVDSMSFFFGQNILAIVNSRTSDKALLYVLKLDTTSSSGFSAQSVKVSNASGPNFETSGHIITQDFDPSFNGRLILAASQSIFFYRATDLDRAILPSGSPLSICTVSATAEIRAILALSRTIVNRQGINVLINFLAVGLSTNNGSQGEVQFINTTPNQLAACTGATTPASLVTMGPISTLAKALEIDSGVRQQLPKAQDQPVFVFATARDGRVYPYRVAPINEDPTKLAARFAPNDESKDTPFVPVQPIQAFPFVETAVSSANSPAVFIYYVSDAVYCRRYSPLLDTVQGQLTLCSETAPSANTLFLR